MADLLIVDDDVDAVELLARLLRAEGHDVRYAVDAGGALRRLAERAPDLVLLDLGLPRVFGLDLLDALRADGRLAGVPVVVYTGRDEPDVREAARRLGACGFVAKGQAWPAVVEQIEACLPRRQGTIEAVEGPPPADSDAAHRAFAG